MRTYLILKEKAKRWTEDKEIQGLLSEIRRDDPDLEALCRDFNPDKAEILKGKKLDRKKIAEHSLRYEKLDQLTCEIIYGVR